MLRPSTIVSPLAALACALLAATRVPAAPVFQRLNFYPTDVSADGSVVVGARNFEAVRWTASEGVVGLGQLPGEDGSYATGLSADGRVVVGGTTKLSPYGFNDGAIEPRPLYWTTSGAMTELGTLPTDRYCTAFGVSADGAVVVGNVHETQDIDAFRWTPTTGITWLGTGTRAADVSADGSVVVGAVARRAARWTGSGGWAELGASWPDAPYSRASAASADGSVVVGTAYDQGHGHTLEAFRWTASGGAERLGFLPGVSFSEAVDVSADGSVVVGWSRTNFIWDPAHGMRPLQDLLEGLGADLTGVELGFVNAISADGRTVVGQLFDPTDPYESLGFVATVPEPAGLAVIALAVSVVLRRRHRRPRDSSRAAHAIRMK